MALHCCRVVAVRILVTNCKQTAVHVLVLVLADGSVGKIKQIVTHISKTILKKLTMTADEIAKSHMK